MLDYKKVDLSELDYNTLMQLAESDIKEYEKLKQETDYLERVAFTTNIKLLKQHLARYRFNNPLVNEYCAKIDDLTMSELEKAQRERNKIVAQHNIHRQKENPMNVNLYNNRFR